MLGLPPLALTFITISIIAVLAYFAILYAIPEQHDTCQDPHCPLNKYYW